MQTRAAGSKGRVSVRGTIVLMTADMLMQSWWAELTPEQRERASAIASRPAPRGMAIDDLTATMIRAGLPTSRQVWTGQPEHLVEMLDEVADFVTRASRAS